MKKFLVVFTIVAFFGAISAPAYAAISDNVVLEKVEGEPKKDEKKSKKAEKKSDCQKSCDEKKEKKACGDKDKK